MKFEHLTVADEGVYTCVVSNSLGSIDFNFTLEVVGLFSILYIHIYLALSYIFVEIVFLFQKSYFCSFFQIIMFCPFYSVTGKIISGEFPFFYWRGSTILQCILCGFTSQKNWTSYRIMTLNNREAGKKWMIWNLSSA